LSVDNILGTAGATGGMVGALLNDCRPGDKVLLPEPFFIGHKLMLEALGFEVEYYKVPLNEEPDWEEIKEKMSNVKALILTTPSNPTGQVASVEVLKSLSEVASEKNCLLILDEMYREFIWSEEVSDDSAYADLDLTKTVLVRSFSKTFAIPGWRVGFVVTSPERAKEMATKHDALYLGGSTLAQNALAEVLDNNLDELNEYVANLRELLKENMKLLAGAFKEYGFTPLPVPATYYMLLKHGRGDDMAVVEELIAKKIVTTPLNVLYSNVDKKTGYIRIHFALTVETVKGVQEILSA
jgi:aspartate/methionine/tyrosine aminotransferase